MVSQLIAFFWSKNPEWLTDGEKTDEVNRVRKRGKTLFRNKTEPGLAKKKERATYNIEIFFSIFMPKRRAFNSFTSVFAIKANSGVPIFGKKV